jgi:carbon-monoxide dehydrogenase large subunit
MQPTRSSHGIGAPMRRVEDARFLRGAGRFVDDMQVVGAARLYVLRSPHAAARIVRVNASAAQAMPGVLLVLAGADVDGLGVLRCITPRHRRDGKPLTQTP